MANPLKFVKPFIVKHEPEILLSMGISGMIFSTIWAVKATVKTTKAVEDYKKKKNIDKITFKELFKLAWKDYIPSVISVGVSIPCLICSNVVSNKRYAALATAYTISETALTEYQAKTKELLGEKKAQQIREAVSADKVQKTYSGESQIIMTGNGESLFYEPLSGRYFKSNWNDILKAANELNSEALGNLSGEISLNQWFNKLGLESIDLGSELGWNTLNGPNNLISIDISSHITSDNVPCGAISYINNPVKI